MVARRNIKIIGKLIFKSLLLPCLLLHALPIAAFAEENTDDCLKLGADESLTAFYPLFNPLIISVYKRAGYCATSIALAAKRSEKMLANNTLDGEWFRVKGYAEEFHLDLIRLASQ